jgi:hypothetical protein
MAAVIDLTEDGHAEPSNAELRLPAPRPQPSAAGGVVDLTEDAIVVYVEPPVAQNKKRGRAGGAENAAALNTKAAEELVGMLVCPVCLDSPMTEISSTLCGHLFCGPCIAQAIDVGKKCPTCKSKLGKKSFHRVFL